MTEGQFMRVSQFTNFQFKSSRFSAFIASAHLLRLFHSREVSQKIPKDAFNSLWGLFRPRFVTFFRLQRRLKTDFGLVQKQPNKHYLVKIVTEYGKNRPF